MCAQTAPQPRLANDSVSRSPPIAHDRTAHRLGRTLSLSLTEPLPTDPHQHRHRHRTEPIAVNRLSGGGIGARTRISTRFSRLKLSARFGSCAQLYHQSSSSSYSSSAESFVATVSRQAHHKNTLPHLKRSNNTVRGNRRDITRFRRRSCRVCVCVCVFPISGAQFAPAIVCEHKHIHEHTRTYSLIHTYCAVVYDLLRVWSIKSVHRQIACASQHTCRSRSGVQTAR